MQATEDRPMTGGAGWRPIEPTTPDQAMRVLAGRIPEDSQYRNACQWALMLFDYPDFIADMPVNAKRQLFELIENNRGTRYAAIRNYVADAVESILEES